jgi:ubiquinone/menaquinone biosynthesis C-methylase UbiE
MSFDDIASVYDETRAIPNWIVDKFYYRVFRSEVQLNSDLFILDAGIGTGRMVEPILNYDVHLVGVDISKEMIKRMIEKLAKKSASGQVSLILADVTALPFREHVFDFVISAHVLHLIKEWRKAIDETKRVSRGHGSFSVVGHTAPELISKTGKKYFEIAKKYSSKGLARRSMWILNVAIQYERTGFLKRISRKLGDRNNFWGNAGRGYLKKQAFSMDQYIIKWEEIIDTNEIFNHLNKRILSNQWRIPLLTHEKIMFELKEWKDNEIIKNGPTEKIQREFEAIMVKFE